jgi:hypothetical protein
MHWSLSLFFHFSPNFKSTPQIKTQTSIESLKVFLFQLSFQRFQKFSFEFYVWTLSKYWPKKKNQASNKSTSFLCITCNLNGIHIKNGQTTQVRIWKSNSTINQGPNQECIYNRGHIWGLPLIYLPNGIDLVINRCESLCHAFMTREWRLECFSFKSCSNTET